MLREIKINLRKDCSIDLYIETDKSEEELKPIIEYFETKFNEITNIYSDDIHDLRNILRTALAIIEELISLRDRCDEFIERISVKLDNIVNLINPNLS